MNRTAMLVVVCGLGVGIVLADAQKDFAMLFGAEARKVAATSSTADDAALAGRLLDSAKSLGGQPALQLLLYEKAYAFGLKNSAGHAKALEALKLLAESAPDRAEKVAERGYRTGMGAARKAAGKAYMEMLLARADATMEDGSTVEAGKLYAKAHPIATYLRSPRAAEIVARRRELAQRVVDQRRRETKLKGLQVRLERNPKDAEARKALIFLYLLEDDKPEEAAKLVTDDLDETFRTYLPLATKPLEDLPETVCLELAGWYEQLGAKMMGGAKEAALCKAVSYYRAYLDRHAIQDAQTLKAKMALAKVVKSLETLRGPGDRVLFLADQSMEVYPLGYRQMKFPVQKTRDPCGPFKGQAVYFNQRTGKDVVYEISSSRPVRTVWYRGAAMREMTIEALRPDGKVLAKTGPHGGGNHWGEFRLNLPGRGLHRFSLRFRNHIATWFLIASIKFR